MVELYKSRKKISDHLSKVFYNITVQFTTSSEQGSELDKFLASAVRKFEKELSKLTILDKEFTIIILKSCLSNFKSYTDISNPYENDVLRAVMLKLPIESRDTFLVNREIAVSIADHFLKELIEMNDSTIVSNLHFKSFPGDFVELVTALHKNGNIERLDKKKLTQKEIQAQFRQFFNLEKETQFDDQNLSKRLSERKNAKDKTLFLEQLKKTFIIYSEEKNS